MIDVLAPVELDHPRPPHALGEVLVRGAHEDLLHRPVVGGHGRGRGQGVVGFELHHGPDHHPQRHQGGFEEGELGHEQLGSTPSPVLYPGHMSLRKDSTTWSVATPTWVARAASIDSTDCTTPRTAPTSPPSELARGGAP